MSTGTKNSERPQEIAASWTESLRTTIMWGVGIGILQAFSPVGFPWLDSELVWALGLVVIASIYIGFAVADGRPVVIAVEVGVAACFIVLAAIAVTASPWLAVVGLVGHGIKDMWQHRRRFVANTRWWPPFCAAVDFVVAAIIAAEIASGFNFHN